jgi:hypothetical protein
MESCVELQTNETIARGEFGKYSYGPILKSCATQYGSLAVARYGDGLPPLPYEYWQLQVLKRLSDSQSVNQNKQNIQIKGEQEFLTGYYALQGRVVIVSTALEKCPQTSSLDGKISLHKNNLSQIREILIASDDFIKLRDRAISRQLSTQLEQHQKKLHVEFIKALDSAFVPEKISATCSKALDFKITEATLVDFLNGLDGLNGVGVSQELSTSILSIKRKISTVLGSLQKV